MNTQQALAILTKSNEPFEVCREEDTFSIYFPSVWIGNYTLYAETIAQVLIKGANFLKKLSRVPEDLDVYREQGRKILKQKYGIEL